MKRLACLIGIISVVVLVTNCQAAETAKKGLRFVFITPCVGEGFFRPVKKGMLDASRMMGVECTFIGTKDVDLKAQAEMARKAIAEGYDGIAISLIDPEAFDDVVKEAMDQGIPVVAFNVDDSSTPNARLSAVCQNLYQAGRSLGEAAAKFIPANSEVLMTLHSEGISALDDRLRGVQDVLRQKGVSWEVVVTGIAPEEAVEVITKALREHPGIKTVLCTGQVDTEAAGLAIEKGFQGKGYAAAGFDLSPEILRLIKAGVIRFTIDQQPYIQGFYPVVQLALYRRYGIKPSSMDAGAGIITKENVDAVMELSRRGYR
jgi:simple sugar transport system substrate-binding protein